ncbi:MAG: helix-turn-helix domain-containing protein [Moorea sp. SIO2B7]|nr:helix-turn-helix domain-containing protein [Moorena sp. SIO2B7]
MSITKAVPIKLSNRQETLLKQIVRGTTNPDRLLRRAKLIRAAASAQSNNSISRRLELDREQVRLWRERWREAADKLLALEEQQITDKKLIALICEILRYRPRAGTKKSFSVEQVVKIVALACEAPEKSERPISHGTTSELAAEAVKRGIVAKISPRSVGRFLTMSYTTTTWSSLLVK